MVKTRVVLRRGDSTSICFITVDELLAVNVRRALAKLSRGLARYRGALNGSEMPEQQKRMHRWPSDCIFRQAHGDLPV